MDKKISMPLSKEDALSLNCGDYVYLTGTIYTARDAAHKRMYEALRKGEALPIDIKGQTIYYMGPSPAREGRPIGSAGPTTASRMDRYAPTLLDLGLRGMIGKGKYTFIRNKHTYFGIRKEVEIFDQPIYAYIYVDQYNALQRFRDYLIEHKEEYDSLKDKEKDWYTVKYGYFVLLSNIDTTPEELLTQYFCRTEIETVFKTSKEYLDLLPLKKWTDETVRGKILHDVINTIVLLELRKEYIPSGISINEIAGKTQSLMCNKDRNGLVNVETPNKKTKEYYNLLGVEIPSNVRIDAFKHKVLCLS